MYKGDVEELAVQIHEQAKKREIIEELPQENNEGEVNEENAVE